LSQGKTIKSFVLTLESGRTTPVSGIYRCEHSGCSEKVIWIRRDEILPACPYCGKRALFSLEEKVQHISEDPDFKMA
jgi:DNA-directed RNA polymerase subunit RPC12/RpoP